MGNLIKINMYVEQKRRKGKIIDIKTLEKNIFNYSNWLQNNHREDGIKSYDEFLHAQ